METIIGLKELRENTETYISEVKKGKSFLVVRKSRPVFKVSPPDDEEAWEVAADFTKLKRGGIGVKELLRRL
ncbi:MAG: type II toxin-antitoxin system prevent-host-death family antitoxin [Patescibacteria group bacterium]